MVGGVGRGGAEEVEGGQGGDEGADASDVWRDLTCCS